MNLKVLKKQNNSRMCIVCGTLNSASLKCPFYELEGDIVVAPFVGQDIHQSYPGRMHGGIISALLDEIAGRAVQIAAPDQWGVTGELTVRYKRPVPLGEPLLCVGKVVRDTPHLFFSEAFIEDRDGKILATSKATYVKLAIADIADGFGGKDWSLQTLPDEPKSFDVKNSDYFNR